MPRIIPVIDVMDGVVVHGIGGRRETYRPIQSSIVDSTEPLKVAEAMLAKTRSKEIYIADLDAIRSGGPITRPIWEIINHCQSNIWLDYGLRTFDGFAEQLFYRNHVHLVIPTESCASIDDFLDVTAQWPVNRLLAGIDLFEGRLKSKMFAGSADEGDPRFAINWFVEKGMRSLIILDIARVGMMAGPGTEELCEYAHQCNPDLQIFAGGGINGVEYLNQFNECGIDGVLVASAIHNGKLP